MVNVLKRSGKRGWIMSNQSSPLLQLLESTPQTTKPQTTKPQTTKPQTTKPQTKPPPFQFGSSALKPPHETSSRRGVSRGLRGCPGFGLQAVSGAEVLVPTDGVGVGGLGWGGGLGWVDGGLVLALAHAQIQGLFNCIAWGCMGHDPNWSYQRVHAVTAQVKSQGETNNARPTLERAQTWGSLSWQ